MCVAGVIQMLTRNGCPSPTGFGRKLRYASVEICNSVSSASTDGKNAIDDKAMVNNRNNVIAVYFA